MWGLLPLYMAVLAPAGALEIVVVRIGFALIFCLLLLTVMRRLRELGRRWPRPAAGAPRVWPPGSSR